VGAGRPRGKSKREKAAFFTLRIEEELLERAHEEARARGVPLSELVRDALSRLAGGRRKPRPRRSEKSRQS